MSTTETMIVNELETTALEYAARDWPVLPLHSIRHGNCTCDRADCGSPGKHPRTQHGLKDASTDIEIIHRWWRRWPDSNIGIVTGAASGFIVLDVDPRNGGDMALDELLSEHDPLPETPEALTCGGGRHILFRHPGGMVRNDNQGKLGSGLDVKGDGGYIIVAAPSLHASGKRYEWEASSNPADIPLADCPAWLIERLRTDKPKATTSTADQVDEAGIPGDANGDTVVSADDYGSVQASFGNTIEMGSDIPIPEPATMSLLAIIRLALLRRKRK